MQWALPTARLVAAGTAVLVLVQGALAGSHLGGADGALSIHRSLGTEVLSWLALVVVVTSALAFKRSRWRLLAATVGFMGMGTQIGMGFADRLAIHLPLGIALFGLYAAMALAPAQREERP